MICRSITSPFQRAIWGLCIGDRITHCARLIVSCFRWRISRPTSNDSRRVYWTRSGPCNSLRAHGFITALLIFLVTFSVAFCHAFPAARPPRSLEAAFQPRYSISTHAGRQGELPSPRNEHGQNPIPRQNLFVLLTSQNTLCGSSLSRPAALKQQAVSFWIPRPVF